METFLIGLVFGIIIGIFLGAYISTHFDVVNQVYQIKRLKAKKGGKIDVAQNNEDSKGPEKGPEKPKKGQKLLKRIFKFKRRNKND